MAKRTNQEWIADLRASGPRQEQALADLRQVILAGLPYALEKWLSPSDPRFEAFADEVAQDTLLRVIERLDSFAGRSQFTTWVHTIAVRVALTELRRSRWGERSLDEMVDGKEGEEAPKELPDPGAGVESTLERKDVLAAVQRVIYEDLSEKQRAALIALSVEGASMDEVARRLGTQRNALYKLLHDARVKLKQRLESEGLSTGEILSVFDQR